jgi:uncharacterized protein (UPF0261 family)
MKSEPRVLLVACLDTKGQEADYTASCLREVGLDVWIMDTGILGQSYYPARITREEVARAGGMPLQDVRVLGHEGKALEVMTNGAVSLAGSIMDDIGGVIGLGGSMGTTLGTAVMRAFPVGIPKVMISTMASRDTSAFVGTKDICMLHAVSDLAGLNRITRKVLYNGANALAGMVKADTLEFDKSKPLVAMSTLGTTEVCAQCLRRKLDEHGFETVVFHSVGAGGAAMEEMIKGGEVQAVVDLSLHELADHYFGGDYDAGPDRGYAAGQQGIPTVLVPGNIDFLVTGPLRTAQQRFPGRPCHAHNQAITVVRSTREETEHLSKVVANIANSYNGPVRIIVPLKGFSAFDHPENGPMPDPEAPVIFRRCLGEALDGSVPLNCVDLHVNDPEFTDVLAESIIELWSSR